MAMTDHEVSGLKASSSDWLAKAYRKPIHRCGPPESCEPRARRSRPLTCTSYRGGGFENPVRRSETALSRTREGKRDGNKRRETFHGP